MTTFHHAPINSARIQRVIQALSMAGDVGLTTLDLNDTCGSTRASSDVSECRAVGYQIECQYQGQSESGRRIHRYRLKPE